MEKRLYRIAYKCAGCGAQRGDSYIIFPWQWKYQPTHELAWCQTCNKETAFKKVEVGA